MRIGYSDEEQWPGQFELWQANCARSLQGRAGQTALRELETALLALPTKRLIAGELDNGADCCAVGALVRHKGIVLKADPEDGMEEIGVECGLPRLVAWKVVEMNDVEFRSHWSRAKYEPFTPEERYTAMLAWVRDILRPTAQESTDA